LASPAGSRAHHIRSYDLSLPADLAAWRHSVAEEPEKYWVLKPCLAGASKGIQVRRGQAALHAQKTSVSEIVAQEYLERPFLGLGGRKFHLRLYVLVSRWSPTIAYLFDEGLVFHSRHNYASSGPGTGRDVFSSISKSVEAFSLAELWRRLDSSTLNTFQESTTSGLNTSNGVQQQIRDALVEVLSDSADSFNVFSNLEEERGFSCFDLLGADIILDEQLQPFIMEINVGPNLWIDNHGSEHMELLQSIKNPMMSQIAHWASLTIQNGRVLGLEQLNNFESTTSKALSNFTRIL